MNFCRILLDSYGPTCASTEIETLYPVLFVKILNWGGYAQMFEWV